MNICIWENDGFACFLSGKDITHKMYSLNEQLGQAKSFDDQTRAARNDHWRQAIYRSVSFDAVNTGTKGTVRSNAWKRYRDRKASLFADPVDSEYTNNLPWLTGPGRGGLLIFYFLLPKSIFRYEFIYAR